jgi:arylsulfatase A-like enzyme
LDLASAWGKPDSFSRAAEAHQSAATMRTASLLLVFLFAKVVMLAGSSVPLSWWSPIAFLWQDAAVVLVFGTAEFFLRPRGRVIWAVYGTLVLYTAINIPIVRVLGTPLTWPMLRATRGPLADSIRYYVTWQNVLLVAAALALAVLSPLVLRRVSARPVIAGLILCVVLGPFAGARVDTRGFDRSAWPTLIDTAIPRLPSRARNNEWRFTGFDQARQIDLSRFQGVAAGRNIVLIVLESTGAQYLRLYGAETDVMPRLSELARNAIVFDHVYAVYPESIKGLFSVLCSMYPAFDSSAAMYAAAPCRSIASVLADAGYRTALFHSGRFGYLGMEAVIRNRGYGTLEDAGHIGGNHNSSFGVDEPAAIARVLKWIDAQPAEDRFFVTYLPIAGHHPYETPEPGPFPNHDEFGRYCNSLHYADASLGTLLDGFRARGLYDKTVWVIFGDHGEAFGQHEGNYGHTFHIYDENVRVPFVIAAPGLISSQVRSRQVVSLIDTAPTMLDVIGFAAPANYQGRSMLDSQPRMAFFFADYSLGLLGLRDGPKKFIHELESGRSRLFDLDKDPHERIDLSEQHAEQTLWYEANLRNWSQIQKHRITAAK